MERSSKREGGEGKIVDDHPSLTPMARHHRRLYPRVSGTQFSVG